MRIVISSDPILLNILWAVVRYRAQEVGFPEQDAEGLALAVNEAASNVMRHAYGNRRDARLAIEILTFSDRMEFILEDWGRKVRPEEIRPRPLEELRPGGLGTHIIQCLTDERWYDMGFAEGNRLKMVKYLPRKATDNDESANQDGR